LATGKENTDPAFAGASADPARADAGTWLPAATAAAGAFTGRWGAAPPAAAPSAEYLTMQHAARQALLRRQYDLLRAQMAASRSSADFFGRHAQTAPLGALADVEKQLTAARQPPLSLAQALGKADAAGLC